VGEGFERQALIVGAPGLGVTAQEEGARRVNQPHGLSRVACLLAAIIACLLRRVLGVPDAAFGPIVANGGSGVPPWANRTACTIASAARPEPRIGLGHPEVLSQCRHKSGGGIPHMCRVACGTTNRA